MTATSAPTRKSPDAGTQLPAATVHDFQHDIDTIGRNSAVPTILESVCLATGMGFAAIARVTDSRWVTCLTADHLDFGLRPGDELDVQTTLCHEVRQSEQEIVIDDVQTDKDYCDHHTPAMYGFRSYVSVPIRREDGSFFGTLCALDPQPRVVGDARVLDMFRLFARVIGDSLETGERLRETEYLLEKERDLGRLQDELVAILGHDLRNPVAAIRAGLKMLAKRPLDDRSAELVQLLRASTYRMSGLITNILDHARLRFGTGFEVHLTDGKYLGQSLQHVVDEIRAVSPDRRFDVDIRIDNAPPCDQERLGQLLSNLVGNAVTHGDRGGPISVTAHTTGGHFEIAVGNTGAPIPAELQDRLFEPFARGDPAATGSGIGLGLHIAAQIAEGHGGEIRVSSSQEQTVFAFRMPA